MDNLFNLHWKNVIVDKQGKLFVVDWEWATENKHLYDVTGKGELPPNGIKQTVFSNPPVLSLSKVLGLVKEDFLMFV